MKRLRTWLVRWAVRALAATWRIEVVGEEHLARVQAAPGAFVYAVWHRSLIPLVWWHRNRGITLLVSAHEDGSLLAEAARRWGYRLVRGSSGGGGLQALRSVVRTLHCGGAVAVTPDGPRGPHRVAKPGVLVAARLAGVPILPIAADASSIWSIGSWDQMLIPRPFARVRVVYREPLTNVDETTPVVELAGRLDEAAAVASEAA